jgi:hypothetical protein
MLFKEMTMKKKTLSIALAAVLFAAGASAASAAGTSSTSSTMAKPGASDTLSLPTAQQKTIWKDLKSQASNQTAPSGFQATVGSALPASVKIMPVPSKVATDVPALKPYDFAMVAGKILIVNPSDKKIVDVITG